MATLADNDAISGFVNKLIEDRGFLDITPEVKEEIKRDIMTRLDDFIAARVIAVLSDEDVQTFSNMLKEGKTSDEIQSFVTTHVPDFTSFLTNTLMEFRDVYLGVVTSPPAA